MKSLIFALLLIGSISHSWAQEIINTGYISYETTKRFTNKKGDPKTTKTNSTFWFNASNARTENILRGLLFTAVFYLDNKESEVYITNGDEYYTMVESELPSLIDMGKYADQEPKVEFIEETKTIGNYNCKKAFLNYEIDNIKRVVEVWYAPSIQLSLHENIKSISKDVKGLPVLVTFVEQPVMSIGQAPETNVTVQLTDVMATATDYITKVKDAGKYQPVAKDEVVQTIMNLMAKSKGAAKPNVTPQGEVIEKTVTMDNGVTATMKRYVAFKKGQQLTEFEAELLGGSKKKLSDYGKRIKVINFWFTKCGPCIKEMPDMNKAKAAFANEPVDFIAVTYNKAEEVQAFLKTEKFDFEHLVNGTKTMEQFNIFTYPTTIVVDENNIVQAVEVGEIGSPRKLIKLINTVLKKDE